MNWTATSRQCGSNVQNVKAATAGVRVRTSLSYKTMNQVEKLDNLQ